MKSLLVTIAVAVLAITGCGGGETETNWTEQDVITAADLTPDPYGGISYTTPEGCNVAVILTNKAEVDLYADAGDTVAMNPSGTAGYKTSDDPGCKDWGDDRLKALE